MQEFYFWRKLTFITHTKVSSYFVYERTTQVVQRMLELISAFILTHLNNYFSQFPQLISLLQTSVEKNCKNLINGKILPLFIRHMTLITCESQAISKPATSRHEIFRWNNYYYWSIKWFLNENIQNRFNKKICGSFYVIFR